VEATSGEPASPRAELSSLSTALEELSRRVTDVADRTSGSDLDWVATDLFEVERSLGEARRRLAKTVERLGPRRA
jgi:hypothetical protein